MGKPRYSARVLPNKRVEPFHSPEDVWFWFMRCTRARIDGARFDETATDHMRPCEPDDVYRIVMDLRRRRILTDAHLRVLTEFGWRDVPPDSRVREEQRALHLWDDAMDRMVTPMTARGIVIRETEDAHYAAQG